MSEPDDPMDTPSTSAWGALAAIAKHADRVGIPRGMPLEARVGRMARRVIELEQVRTELRNLVHQIPMLPPELL